MNPMETLEALGVQAGLPESSVKKALGRIALSVATMMPQGGAGLGDLGTRLLAGLSKNMSDNPMVVAWALKVAATVSDPVWRSFVDNFLLGLVSERKLMVEKLRGELGFPPPVTLVLNPTMRCNLRCHGCYAYNFENRADMDRAVLERVISEARDMGVQFITITGGEPFVYPEIEEVFAHFPDITFMVYTNAQCIDRARAERLSSLGNVWPAISVEGFEEETDRRRGQGVYRGILRAMGHLREAGMMFGISTMPTRENSGLLSSDRFLAHYIAQGALFGWMFTYMPVGRNPDPGLMATPQQRDELRRQGLHWRRTQPFFWVDFWNDGPLCGGCMSASRFAFITSDGWAQPCTFVHFATHNVKDSSLREIFGSPFFRAIRDRQPYGSNLLRPCKIVDHPHVLREIVKSTGARPTYPGAEAVIQDPVIREALDCYSREYAVLADRAWASEDYAMGHRVAVPFYGQVDLHQIYRERLANAHRQNNASLPASPPEPGPRQRPQDR